ncbi:MAG: hypothetical protein ABIR70_09540 [Bryobacteraceae bacterium]
MGNSNSSLYLSARLDKLRNTQNADGGWAFYARKTNSWVEPTVFAALALHGQPEAQRAWELLRGWQLASGGWRPTGDVPGANWTTALAVLLGVKVAGQADGQVAKGIEWLRNNAVDGAWAWRRGSLPAAEPTALGILALRSAGIAHSAKDAEGFLLTDKLTPETCGPALVGLQGSSQIRGLAPLAVRWAEETCSPLTRAWIQIGLRVNGIDVAESLETPLSPNLAVVALEALAAQDGNHGLLRTEAA